ncbi:MAG: phosphate ABC transporter permease PstA [Chloroflexi bacterium]|nr:phosphate ABC transporter permease PstA [Chloroflexota bacterium]
MANQSIRLRAGGAVARRQLVSRASRYFFLGATVLGVSILLFLGYETIVTGASRLSLDFLTNYPSRFAEKAGLRPAMFGTFWLMLITIFTSIPIAIGTAIWIEEFAPRNRLMTIVKINLANLAGVPSIIYGILGLTIFVRFAGMDRSLLAGGFTLALMIIPMTVIASQEAIRQVPPSLRDGALALGATRWQAVRYNVLPNAIPGIMTGTILSISRAIGETAALLMIGGFTFIRFDPGPNLVDFADPAAFLAGLNESFTVIPIQIYAWSIDSRREFQANAAAAIIVLMVGVMALNLLAAVIRERFRRN